MANPQGEQLDITQGENLVIDTINDMLKKPDFLFPFVAAQGQYRAHYYGLTAAALLEYFFIDMLSQYVSIFDSTRTLSLPQHGEPEWDYEFDGVKISHKVGEKISDISGLWDATAAPENGLYSSKTSIIYSIVNYADKWGTLSYGEQDVDIAGIKQIDHGTVSPKQRILICRKNEQDWTVLEEIRNNTSEELKIVDLLPFKTLWRDNQYVLNLNANSIEVFLVKDIRRNETLENFSGKNVSIQFKFLPGLYLLDKDFLKDIHVVSNNRSSVLIPTRVVKEAMNDAISRNAFAYMPTWFSMYSQSRPPNLYLSQREVYSAMHSHIEIRR